MHQSGYGAVKVVTSHDSILMKCVADVLSQISQIRSHTVRPHQSEEHSELQVLLSE